MRIAGAGEIDVWEGASLWLLDAQVDRAETAPHAHHAIQLTFCLEGVAEVRTAGQCLTSPGVAVEADIEHAFAATGRVAFLFVEPESAVGRAMHTRFFTSGGIAEVDLGPFADILDGLRSRRLGEDGQEPLRALGRRLVDRLACGCQSAPLDPRIQRMIDFAASHLDQPISLAAATSAIGLSPNRLRHLFVEETGLAFKTYVLWLRIARALEQYASGSSLTDAAHDAGFADSAHLSRTFRRTFGVPAASLRITAGRAAD